MRVAHVSRARDNNEAISIKYSLDDDEAYEMRDTDESLSAMAGNAVPGTVPGTATSQRDSSVAREIEQAKREEFEKALKAVERGYSHLKKGAKPEKPIAPIIA